MSITVNQIVLHQLVKHAENETTTMESVLRDELLAITPEVEQMMLQLHQGYQNKAKHLASSKRIPFLHKIWIAY